MKKIILTLLTALYIHAGFAQRLYKYNLEIGKNYSNSLETSAKITHKIIGGQDIVTDLTLKQTIETTPIAFENDIYHLNLTYKSLTVDTKNGWADIQMDASDDSSNPMNKMISNLLNKKFQVEMKSNGQVLKISGLSEIIQSLTDGIDLPEDQKEILKKSLTDKINEKSIERQLNAGGLSFPEKEVKVGDSWTNSYKVNPTKDTEINYETLITLKESTENYIICSVNAVGKTANNDEKGPSSTCIGEFKLDAKTGWIIEGDFKHTIKGNFKIENPMDPEAEPLQFYMEIAGEAKNKGL